MLSSIYISDEKVFLRKFKAHCILQIMKNLSYHQKTASGLEWKKEMQLFRVVLCSFCVDAAHQKWDVDSTYTAPISWQVVKDYAILLTV